MDHETYFEDDQWELVEEDFEPIERPWWKGPVMALVAVVTVAALAIVPLYNLFWASPVVADNGLEVCGFDYCVVQDAVRSAGLGDEMSRLSNKLLSEAEARELANTMVAYLGIADVDLVVVDILEGDLDGQYDPNTRRIEIQNPARAWTVAHEVAHAVASGHGGEFQRVIIDLAGWIP